MLVYVYIQLPVKSKAYTGQYAYRAHNTRRGTSHLGQVPEHPCFSGVTEDGKRKSEVQLYETLLTSIHLLMELLSIQPNGQTLDQDV